MYARVAQLVRAFGYEPKGREFESCHARHKKPNDFCYSVFYYTLYNLSCSLRKSCRGNEKKQEKDVIPNSNLPVFTSPGDEVAIVGTK